MNMIYRGFNQLTQREWLAVLVCGVLGWLVAWGEGLIRGIPYPSTWDENCMYLQAQTFALGRLTNPPIEDHLAPFFEEVFTLIQPTRMAKFPPGQGLVLALGYHVFGDYVYGVYLSFGLFSAALCWMLFAWTTPRLAVFTTIFMIFQIGIVNQYSEWPSPIAWTFSYMGQSVTGLGAALLFGGLRRVWTKPTWGHSVAIGLGLVILSNTRPYEGFLVAVPSALVLSYFLVKNQIWNHRYLFVTIIFPLGVVLLLGFLWLAMYNKAVTGNPFVLPYQLHHKQYFKNPLFLFQSDQQPTRITFCPSWMREFYLDNYRPDDLLVHLRWTPRFIFKLNALFCLNPAGILIVVIGCLGTIQKKWNWFPVLVWTFLMIGFAVQTWSSTFRTSIHYLVPGAPLVYAFFAESLGSAHALLRSTFGSLTKWLLLLLLIAGAPKEPLVQLAQDIQSRLLVGPIRTKMHLPMFPVSEELRQCFPSNKHLVFCEEVPFSNEPDIESAFIIWANNQGSEANQKLIRLYPDRVVWYVDKQNVLQKSTSSLK